MFDLIAVIIDFSYKWYYKNSRRLKKTQNPPNVGPAYLSCGNSELMMIGIGSMKNYTSQYGLEQGFSTWGTRTPGGTWGLFRGYENIIAEFASFCWKR